MTRPQTPAARTDPAKLTPGAIAKSFDSAESRLDWLEAEHMKLAMSHDCAERNIESNTDRLKDKATGELSVIALVLAIAAIVGHLIAIDHMDGKIEQARTHTHQTPQGGTR